MTLAISSRFKRPTLLLIGCGDVGLRVVRLLGGRFRIVALTSSAERVALLRQAGVVPLVGDLDRPATLARLSALADRVLHLAPPPSSGEGDPRTINLLRALALTGRATHIVYGSTTGVYGHVGDERFDETRAVRPATERARRRVEAEARLRWHGRVHGTTISLLRIPGIYALDREGGDPRRRLARGTPVLAAADDVNTNHIHADDLARACIAALFRGLPQRVVHVADDSDLKMGDYFDLAADLWQLARPPRIARDDAQAQLGAAMMSFMSESRRIVNQRLKRELRVRLRYPTVREGLASPATRDMPT